MPISPNYFKNLEEDNPKLTDILKNENLPQGLRKDLAKEADMTSFERERQKMKTAMVVGFIACGSMVCAASFSVATPFLGTLFAAGAGIAGTVGLTQVVRIKLLQSRRKKLNKQVDFWFGISESDRLSRNRKNEKEQTQLSASSNQKSDRTTSKTTPDSADIAKQYHKKFGAER